MKAIVFLIEPHEGISEYCTEINTLEDLKSLYEKYYWRNDPTKSHASLEIDFSPLRITHHKDCHIMIQVINDYP